MQDRKKIRIRDKTPPDPQTDYISSELSSSCQMLRVMLGLTFQEMDGSCVLVLQRKDVLQGLGLKLGPALKIYRHIKRLQTRRDFGF
jgi:hypothetical protein